MVKIKKMHFFVYNFILITCSVGAVACVLSTLFFYQVSKKEFGKAAVLNQQIVAKLMAGNITQPLAQFRHILYTQTKLKAIKSAVDPKAVLPTHTLENTSTHLKELSLRLSAKPNFTIINLDGIVVASTRQQDIGINIASKKYVQLGLAKGLDYPAHIASSQIDDTGENPSKKISGDTLVTLSETITINNKVVGMLTLSTPLRSLLEKDSIAELKDEEEFRTYIFDAKGTLLLQPNKPEKQISSFKNEPWFQQLEQIKELSFTANINAIPSLVSFSSIPTTTWTILLAVPEKSVFAPIKYLLKASALTNAILFIATIASIIFLIRKSLFHLQDIENLQKAVRDASQNMYLILSKQPKVLDVSETFVEILEAPSKEHIINNWRKYAPIVQPDGTTSHELMKHTLMQANETGRARLESTFLTYSKETVPLEVIVVPLTYQGEVGYLLTFNDLRDQKKYEESLLQAQRVAVGASKAKSEFLANMSHEIRTPMNAIIGMSHLAKLTDLTQKQRDYLDKIEISSKSLLTIINDILDFSKIEAGHLSLEEIPFQLQDVLTEIITISNTRINEKDIELLFHINKDVPAHLIGDPVRLRQILTNLITNAIKFTLKGEIIISINMQSAHDQQLLICFSIQDTGIGMKEEQISTLFNAFTQADASTTRRFGGTGLGLTICKQLVTLMGGTIWATSEEGKGSVFTFTVKLKNDTEAKKIHRGFNKEQLQNLSVLVIDDDEFACEILKEMLEYIGMKVIIAFSGEQAIEMALSLPPLALAIIDLRMPGLNGIDTATKLRTLTACSDTPFVLSTSHEHDEDIKKTSLFSAILAKPVFASTLIDTLGEIFINKVPKADSTLTIEAIPTRSLCGHILLAEDNFINQQVAAEMFESLGLQVSIVDNGQKALKAYETTKFDAIFMDIQMPVMDGLEASRCIRTYEKDNNKKPITIIAMTAHALTSDYQKSIDAGMNDHITKPIDPLALTLLLHKLFPQSNLSKEPREIS